MHGNSDAVKILHTNKSHTRCCTNFNKCLACECGQIQGAQITIIRFAIYLQNSETQYFYYTIKTRPTVPGSKSLEYTGVYVHKWPFFVVLLLKCTLASLLIQEVHSYDEVSGSYVKLLHLHTLSVSWRS